MKVYQFINRLQQLDPDYNIVVDYDGILNEPRVHQSDPDWFEPDNTYIIS